MDDKTRQELKGYISLCDQALAPMMKLEKLIPNIMKADIEYLSTQNLQDDKILKQYEKAVTLKHLATDSYGPINLLNELKLALEKY